MPLAVDDYGSEDWPVFMDDLGTFPNFKDLIAALKDIEMGDSDGDNPDEEGEEMKLHEEALGLAELDMNN